MLITHDYNPLTMKESYQQNQIKLTKERIVEEEHRKSLNKKLEK